MLASTRLLSWAPRRSLVDLTASGCTLARAYGTDKHATTVLCVRKDGDVVMVADGQITSGSMIVKPNARKVRKIGGGQVIGGFAGAAADGLTLFERLEIKLEEHPGQLRRAAVELAKAWRQDKVLRRLEASLIVADSNVSLQISGDGDVLEPYDGVVAIGSGSPFALAAARALMDMPHLSAREIAERSMKIAADCCVYTNNNFVWEMLGPKEGESTDSSTDTSSSNSSNGSSSSSNSSNSSSTSSSSS